MSKLSKKVSALNAKNVLKSLKVRVLKFSDCLIEIVTNQISSDSINIEETLNK